MKMLLFVAFLCCEAGTAKGQEPTAFPLDKATRRICYTEVVSATGTSQADLQARARAWANGIALANKPPVVANEQDVEVVTAYGAQPFSYTYVLTKTSRLPRHYTVSLVLHYTVKLALREGRYRYEATDFILEYPTAKPPSPTKLPAEDDLIKTRAINEEGNEMLTAERKSFAAAAAKLQAQLKEKMATPISKNPSN